MISLGVQFPYVRRMLGSTVDTSYASVYGDSGKKFLVVVDAPHPSSCPFIPSWPQRLWPLVVDNSGMFFTGFAGVHLELCSLWLSSGPRCLASWSVWTRRTGMQWGTFPGDDATCVVFPSIGGRPKIFGIMLGLDSTDSLQ